MTGDADVERRLNFADCLIDDAESRFAEEKAEETAQFLQDAVTELSRDDVEISENISKEDLEKCDSLPVMVLRRGAYNTENLPDTFSSLKTWIPDIEIPLPYLKAASQEFTVVIKNVFEAKPKAKGRVSIRSLRIQRGLILPRCICPFW